MGGKAIKGVIVNKLSELGLELMKSGRALWSMATTLKSIRGFLSTDMTDEQKLYCIKNELRFDDTASYIEEYSKHEYSS